MERITLITTTTPVSKTYVKTADGISKSAQGSVNHGSATEVDVTDAAEFAQILRDVTERTDVCIVPGSWRDAEVGVPFKIYNEAEINRLVSNYPGGVVEHNGALVAARLKKGILPSSWILLDADNPPGIPAEWAAKSIGERLAMWDAILPGISKCERIELRGSSARVINGSDPYQASHAWIRVSDPSKIAALKAYIQVEMVTKGLSFQFEKKSKLTTGKTVGIEDRSVFDLAVFDTGRIVFCSKPTIVNMAGYSVRDADVRVVNAGGGVLDVSWIRAPSQSSVDEYKRLRGINLSISGDGLRVDNHGQLTWDTEIERRGVVKTLREWVATMPVGSKLRCESPFRESQSEAAVIGIKGNGEPFVHDVGNGVTYHLHKKSKVVKCVEDAMRAAGVEKPIVVPSAIDAAAKASAFYVKSSLFQVATMDRVADFRERDFASYAEEIFGDFIDKKAYQAVVDGMIAGLSEAQQRIQAKALWAAPYAGFTEYIRKVKQYTTLRMVEDMFATTPRIEIDGSEAVMILPHTPLEVKDYGLMQVQDFESHFPGFGRLVEWVVACRFAKSRKSSYLWLQATSDFGKTFAMRLFAEHGLVVEMSGSEVESIIEGKASGFMPATFLRTWIVFFDEFKSTKSELKQIQQSLQLSPKHQPVTTVNIYAKIFASAEDVGSMAGEDTGVEDQFANRMSYLSRSGRLTDRPMYQAGHSAYFDAVSGWVALRINELVAQYQALGRDRAALEAEKFLDDYHKEHKIVASFKSIGQATKELADDFEADVISAGKKLIEQTRNPSALVRFTPIEKKLAEVIVVKDDDTFVIKRPKRILSDWLNAVLTRDECGKVLHKYRDVVRELGGIQTVWINDATAKGLVISVRKVISVMECEGGDDDVSSLF